jgi:hypothetical protein
MSYGVRHESGPMSTGQTAIALLVGVGRIVGVVFCVGVGATPALVLAIPKGAHADNSTNNASSAMKRRGVCIRICYLSCIAVPIETRDRTYMLF